jgi:nucleoside-diphosphate-sugar epimerase
MNKITIAISGCNGFIGRHLADRFIAEGQKVAPIPRDILTDPAALEAFFKKAKPHYIFLLHSYGNMYDQTDEDEIFSTNIIKTYLILKASLSIEYSALVYVSSSSVYGAKSMPMNERDLLDTDTMYGVTKVGAEYLIRAFAKKYGKPMVSVRPFSVTGIGEQKEHLIPTLINSCLHDKKMKFVKEPTHDFVDVQDVIDGILTVSVNAKGHKGEAINIGTGIYWTNEQVKDAVELITGKKAKITESSSMRSYDTKLWVADPTRLKMMGWFPKKTLEDSIREMVNYHKLS